MKTAFLFLILNLINTSIRNEHRLPQNSILSINSLMLESSLRSFASDTTKPKKASTTVITSTIENNNGKTNIQDPNIFDFASQSNLISVSLAIKDMETQAPLTLVMLKIKDPKTGKAFDPVFNPVTQNFSIQVLPETIVSIYVTAKGYTDASANINDIKHDRSLVFELQKAKPSLVKVIVIDAANKQPIALSNIKIRSIVTKNDKTIVLENGTTDLVYDTSEEIEAIATASGYRMANKKLTIETALAGKRYELIVPLERLPAAATPVIENKPSTKIPVKVAKEKSFSAIEKGKAITLDNLYFDQSSPVLRPESSAQLDELVDILKQDPTIRIEIRGHTDNVGDFDLNVKLSRDRCQSVIDYLIQKGIDTGRLQAVGRGPVDAIAPNTTEENRKKNRRVEFVVL